MSEKIRLSNVELKLISELMKNSRRSDRELAKATGVSQPTISRAIKKLEKQGIVKEYAMVPDFSKLGFRILVFSLVKLKKTLDQKQIENARQIAMESLKTGPFKVVMLERGMGLDFNGMFASYHEDYSSYTKFVQWLKNFEFLEIEAIQSFLVDLEDKVRYRPWTYSLLANYIAQTKEKKE